MLQANDIITIVLQMPYATLPLLSNVSLILLSFYLLQWPEES
jgi:hypothetical protein